MTTRSILGVTLAGAVLALASAAEAPREASAFCGFFVSGAGSEMFNNATQVVLMRKGTRTVLSMQNNYQGPPNDFALVVPVPVVLQEENVKTLPRELFARVDKLGAPRLVEYWEQDPCQTNYWDDRLRPMKSGVTPTAEMAAGAGRDLGVTIEAQFTVGEYQIVILSAKDSTGLDTWLRQENYQIPAGAEPLLRPYVESDMKFFVAKVDPKKVQFEDGQAMLSPLRFHYDSDAFALPIRLGMANSPGTQDLIVNILAPQRYKVSNYPNVTIPTNLDVKDEVRTRFGEFYAALFDRTLESNPKAVVTEYAWDASTCDPCPEPALDGSELMTLGADVIGGNPEEYAYGGMVLTRLHARYAKGSISEDLAFVEAEAIVGGREIYYEENKLEERWRPDSYNNFQGRYVIRHVWDGAINCANPIRGRWGDPPGGQQALAATDLAFAPRGNLRLPLVVAQDIPEIGVKEGVVENPIPPSVSPPGAKNKSSGCASCAASGGLAGGIGSLLLGTIVALVLARRRRP